MDSSTRSGDVGTEPPDTGSPSSRIYIRLPVLIGQACLLALGIGVTVESQALGLWTSLGPGPGLLPLVLGLSLIGLTLIWAVQEVVAHRSRRPAADVATAPLDRPYIAIVLVSLVVLAAVTDLIGFQLSMALFLLLHLKVVGRHGWPLSTVLALVGSLGTFVLFDRVLQVPMPLSSLPLLSSWGL